MAQLTAEQLRKVGNFDTDTITALTADLNAGADVDAIVAPGALSLTRVRSTLSVDGTDAFTLAAPTVVNQRKVITCVGAANTPIGTLTVSSPDDTTGFVCSSTFVFDTVGQSITLEATSALKWRVIAVNRAGGAADNVVIGTTVLTGYNLWKTYLCSATGTVHSTGTKALPNGHVAGETILLSCSTAGLGAAGDIDFTGATILGAAVTNLAGISATTDTAILQWSNAKWQVMYSTGLTFS